MDCGRLLPLEEGSPAAENVPSGSLPPFLLPIPRPIGYNTSASRNSILAPNPASPFLLTNCFFLSTESNLIRAIIESVHG